MWYFLLFVTGNVISLLSLFAACLMLLLKGLTLSQNGCENHQLLLFSLIESVLLFCYAFSYAGAMIFLLSGEGSLAERRLRSMTQPYFISTLIIALCNYGYFVAYLVYLLKIGKGDQIISECPDFVPSYFYAASSLGAVGLLLNFPCWVSLFMGIDGTEESFMEPQGSLLM